MKHKNLTDHLSNQIENLNELLIVVRFQQESLVNNGIDGLEEAIKKEEELLNKMGRDQQILPEMLKKINDAENLGMIEFKLPGFIQAYPDKLEPEYKMLKTLKRRIEVLIKEIGRVNFQNSFLIDHSRDLIREIISTAASKKNIIFDRRV